MANIFTSVLALFFVINMATGLKCYNCESDGGNKQCSWETEECDQSALAASCYTITVPQPDGKIYHKRGCLPQSTCDTVVNGVKQIFRTFSLDLDVNCDTCNSDKCNSATSITGFTLFGLILSAAAFLF